MCKSNFGKRSHHTIFHIWLMFGPFGLFWRCVGVSYRFGVSISFRSGLRFWKVYFLSGRGMERVQIQFLICRSCGCRLGRRFGPYCVYLDPCSAALAPYLGYFRVFVALILDLDISWLLRFGFVGLVFGVGHFKVVGSWPCSSSLWTRGISVSLSFGSLHSVAKENSI